MDLELERDDDNYNAANQQFTLFEFECDIPLAAAAAAICSNAWPAVNARLKFKIIYP